MVGIFELKEQWHKEMMAEFKIMNTKLEEVKAKLEMIEANTAKVTP